MEESIKEIVATFIRVPADQIGPSTPIDRRAVKSSIMLHRMYAKLAEAGLVISDYTSVRTFNDLSGGSAAAGPTPEITYVAEPAPAGDEPLSMGIDIESVGSLPKVADFRRDEFYKQNFTPQEMAWCILQPDPIESFAGLFAAKEALVKADNSLREKPFHQIAIRRSPAGKPLFPGFTLSIAHANGTAVAVAARAAANETTHPTLSPPPAAQNKGRAIVWLALLLATAALILSLWHAK